MSCKTSLSKDIFCSCRLTQGKVQWDQMEESPGNENSGVCSKGVSDPWFRARDLWGFCKRGSRYCSEATSPAPYVVLKHTHAFCSNERIRNCNPPCLLFSMKNFMNFSCHNRTYHLVSHDTNYNLIITFNFFFYFFCLWIVDYYWGTYRNGQF